MIKINFKARRENYQNGKSIKTNMFSMGLKLWKESLAPGKQFFM